jgi:hypothetical protein
MIQPNDNKLGNIKEIIRQQTDARKSDDGADVGETIG